MFRLNNVFIIIFYFSQPCFSKQVEKEISYVKWQQDTLGSKGYRSIVLSNNKYSRFFNGLIGKSRNEIKKIFGVPDFYCKSDKGITNYHYCIEYRENLIYKYFKYIPNQKCEQNTNFGSFLNIEFGKNSKVTFITVIRSGG